MSKARMKNRTLMLILIPIMAVVLVGMIVGNYYALIWNTVISRHFNQQTYRTPAPRRNCQRYAVISQ